MLWRIFLVISTILPCGVAFAGQAGSPDSFKTVSYGRFTCSIASEPDWVELLALPEIKGEPSPGQSVRYLLEDHQVRIGESREDFQRSVRDLISSQGVLRESEIQLYFNPQHQQLILHKVQVTRGGEVLDRLADADIKLLQREEQIPLGIYTGDVSAVIILRDIRPGDRLEYSYTIRGSNPVFGERTFGSEDVGWGVEVGRVQVRVLAPRSRRLRTAVHNTPVAMQERSIGDEIEYRWRQDDTPAVNDEGDYPDWYTPYPWVEYTEYAEWEEVEKWARQLYPRDGVRSDGLAPLVERLKKESRDESDYARRALLFVQQEIRYLGLEMGENSHRPHPPEDVLAGRCGDCKDKARLLVALLRAGGLEAYPALVSADYRGGVRDFLPSPGVFDHVIVMARVGNQTLWLDGTRNDQRGELVRQGFVPYGFALVVGDGRMKPLVEVESLPGQVDRIEVTEHFQAADFNGTVALDVVSVAEGGMAEYRRSVFGDTPLYELTANNLNYYARLYPGIESTGSIEFYDDDEKNIFKAVEHYRIHDFWRQQGGNTLVSDYEVGTIKDFTHLPRTLKRSAPLYLGDPVEVLHRIVVDFPKDVKLDVPSNPLIFKDQASYYQSVNRYSGQRFVNEVKYRLLRSWIEPEKVGEHLGNLRKIAADLDFTLYVPLPLKKLSENGLPAPPFAPLAGDGQGR